MKFTKLAAGIGLAAALAACGGGDGAPADPASQPMDLTILHINDSHSTLDAKSRTLTLKTGGTATATVTTQAAGFPRVTAAMQALAAQSANVLKLHAGDATTGTLYFNRAGADGEADAALMNTVCFDAFTIGNHEFDKGDSGLKKFIDFLHKGACKTPVLSANVNFGASSVLAKANADGVVNKSIVVKRGGQDIGIVGLTIAGKTKASSSPDPDTTFEEETVAAQREIDRLKARGINKIIVMSHIGYDMDRSIVPNLSGVDVVVGGDSHTLLGPNSMAAYGVGTPAGAYPTQLRNKAGKNVCVVQAWEYSQVVGELKVSFDANGDVTSCGGTPHVLIGDSLTIGTATLTVSQREAAMADIAASGFLRVTPMQASATAVLQPFKDKVAVFTASKVAVAPVELCSRRVPGGVGTSDYSRSSVDCNTLGEVNTRGGDIQQLVAQAYLEVANSSYGGADITLQSGGGVRVPLKGEVTAADVISVLPFGNMLFRLDITADEVKTMVEDGLQEVYRTGGSTGPYPYTGGLRFDVDATKAQGSRATNLEVFTASTNSWGPLVSGRVYRLFVLSFNATGGDGYKGLAAVPASRRLDIGVLDADVFQAYIDRQPKDPATNLPRLTKLPASQYSTKSYIKP